MFKFICVGQVPSQLIHFYSRKIIFDTEGRYEIVCHKLGILATLIRINVPEYDFFTLTVEAHV